MYDTHLNIPFLRRTIYFKNQLWAPFKRLTFQLDYINLFHVKWSKRWIFVYEEKKIALEFLESPRHFKSILHLNGYWYDDGIWSESFIIYLNHNVIELCDAWTMLRNACVFGAFGRIYELIRTIISACGERKVRMRKGFYCVIIIFQ